MARRMSLGWSLSTLLVLALGAAGCNCGEAPIPPTVDAAGTDADAGRVDGSRPDGSPDGGGSVCGDGRRARDEVCDDGNTTDGDGCSADCQSDETCGNSFLDMSTGELCDDGNTMDGDGCRGDCLSDYLCGNGVMDTIASGAMADEVCDDGNSVNGDGCSAACDSDESCGNSIVDIAAGEVCDDGNTSGGDDCSADCMTSLLCGNGMLDGIEECDDGDIIDGDGCSATCFNEVCGNGRLDPMEICDDGNPDENDGCRTDCTYTCVDDAACDDGDVCNGTETCTDPGTVMSTCVPPATPAPDGTACGTGLICLTGACATSGCGDGFTDATASEACDDGNTADGDGCDADCTFTCTSDGDCSDGEICTGAETCANAGTATSACSGGTPPPDGTSCGSSLICNALACVPAGCGDGFVSGSESCDDGNTVDADGCDADCTFTCSSDADCSDADVCNGTETCSMAGTATSACNAGTPPPDGTSCGGSNICRALSCVAPGCGDGVRTGSEACDDGNTTDGDGCDSDCTFTCSSDADCSDADVCNGAETCTGGGTTASQCNAGTPPVDGTSCGGANICRALSCVPAACGDGLRTGAEACDDGNTVSGDGCDSDCTFTCSSDADCSDGLVCTGTETCSMPGTTGSRCNAGTAPPDGTSCGGANICRMGACVAPGCGDGIRTGGEACDDANTVDGDGCDADCTFTCTTGADCSDALVCNGTEVCTGGGTLASRCNAGAPPADGTTCGGVNICRMGSCVAAFCGDGLRTGSEACDDGNTTNGDGCESTCVFTCSAAADCSDGLVCNGSETCTMPGTLGSRCNAGTPPADGTTCGGSNICRMGSCVAAFCGDGIRTGTEVCDDGNAVNGDGCETTCRFTCSAAADCTDGLVCNGTETCTMPGTLGSRCNAGAPPADGTSCGGSNICRMGSCVAAFCGDGIRSGSEACDDGNPTNGDGCETTCRFTCSAAADCTDGLVCNGTETCTMPGTLGSRCNAGAPPPAGTSCGGSNICVGGSCVAARCGDTFVTAPEVCDDGNLVARDGCENTCQWTCTSNASCVDTNTCNGAETCTNPSTIASRCNAGAAPPLGTVCDADGMPATRDICRMLMCLPSVCGDGYTDAGRVPAETCDDSNTTSGDGCSSTCLLEMVVPPTAFRITNLDLISPRITVVPLIGCSDATQNPVFGFSVNGALDDAINPMSVAGGTYSLHIVNLFRPLNPAAATTPAELHFNPVCMEAPTPDSCGPAAVPDVIMSIANNQSAGTCFVPVAADVNTRAGTPLAYAPTANTVSAPCFITAPATITVTISGIVIPLQAGRVSATYSGGPPPNRLVSGIVTGFLSERDAADIILPASLPVVGNTPLYSHLQAGNRAVVNSMGMSIPDGCNVSGGTNEDDADMYMGVRGFWFFLNFTADQITWTGP